LCKYATTLIDAGISQETVRIYTPEKIAEVLQVLCEWSQTIAEIVAKKLKDMAEK